MKKRKAKVIKQDIALVKYSLRLLQIELEELEGTDDDRPIGFTDAIGTDVEATDDDDEQADW